MLNPNGNFGTRRLGGKDASSSRYIFTQLNDGGFLLLNVTRELFNETKLFPKFTLVSSYTANSISSSSSLMLFRKTVLKNYIIVDKVVDGLDVLNQDIIITSPADAFIKSIRVEPDTKDILCAYSLDNDELSKDKSIELAKKYQLKINIIKNGIHGSYRRLIVPKINECDSNNTNSCSNNFEIRIEKPGTLLSKFELLF